MLPYSVKVKKTFSGGDKKRHYYRIKIRNLSLFLKEVVLLPS